MYYVRYSDDINNEYSFGIHHPVTPPYNKYPFSIEDFGYMFARSGYFTERKDFAVYLIFVTIGGNGNITYRGETITLEPNEIAIIDCMEPHYYATGDMGFWNFKWAHIKGSSVLNYFSIINDAGFNKVTSDIAAEFISEKLDALKEAFDTKNDMLDAIISNIISNILTETLLHRSSGVVKKKHSRGEDIERVVKFIHDNCRSYISINDLTKIACMSRYHFFRIFKQCVGNTPYEYVKQVKIQEAMKILRIDNLSVQETLNLIKYSNINNFIKDFKKIVGMTPNKYRLMR